MIDSEHSVFVLAPPETLNTCSKILLFYSGNTASVGSVSLYNIDSIYSFLKRQENKNLSVELIKSDGIYKYVKPDYFGERDGFDTILCISDSGEVLGYIKYIEKLGSIKNRPMNIKINLTSTNSGNTDELEISYIVDSLVQSREEEDKYKNYLDITDARELIKDDYNQYTSHASTVDNIFLSDVSVISGETIKLDLSYGEKINPYPETKFDNYFIGYVAGGDIALYSWTSDTYNVVSLAKKDYYGNPKSYIKTKEGRAPTPKYIQGGVERRTKINYISGRFIVCNVENFGTRIYDSFLGEWLTGEFLISDPFSPTNKIYELASKRVLYSDLAKLIPSVSRAYFLEKTLDKDGYDYNEKKKILQVVRVIGNWVIYKEDGNSERLIVCGPMMRLYIAATELNSLMFLNDYTIVQRVEGNYFIYSGKFKTFASELYMSSWPNAEYGGETLSTSSEYVRTGSVYGNNQLKSSFRYYRRNPYPGEVDIITTFAGLLFYKDSDNRLYYL